MVAMILAFLLTASALAAETHPSLILVVEQHSLHGHEQVALVAEPGNVLRLTSNSGFLSDKLPARLGLFRKTVDAAKIGKLRELIPADPEKLAGLTNSDSPHRIRVLANGTEIPAASPLYGRIIKTLKDASSESDWKTIDGRVVTAVDASFKCQDDVCESKYGWVYP